MTEQNGSTTEYKPDVKQIAGFIQSLYGENPQGFFCVAQFHVTDKQKPARQRFIQASDLKTIIKTALEMQAATTEYDNYFGTCTYRSEKYFKDGKEKSGRDDENAEMIPGIFLDLDTNTGKHKKTKNPNTPAEALQVLQSITGEPPTIAINTIGGAHVYYLFQEPFIARSKEEALYMKEEVMQPFYRAFSALYTHELYGGYDEPDNVLHPSRVLRIPGMITRKYGGVVKYIDYGSGPRKRFTIEQIQAITADMQALYANLPKDKPTPPQKPAPPAPNSAGNTSTATAPGERDRSDIDRLKAYLPNYLKDYFGVDHNRMKCLNPNCTSSDPNRPTNMQYNPKEFYVKCHSCNKVYDIYSLIGLNENIAGFIEQKKRAQALYSDFAEIPPLEMARKEGKTDENPSATIEQAHSNAHMTDYFGRRGLTDTIINKYKLGYLPNERFIVLPIGDSYYMRRKVNFKYHLAMNDKPKPIFNGHYLQTATADDVIFITESIIDALSLEVVKPDIKAIALNGTGENLLTHTIKQSGTKAAFVIAVDSDSSGNEAAEKLKQKLSPLGLITHRFNVEAGEGYKDINDYLLADDIGLLAEILQAYESVAYSRSKQEQEQAEQFERERNEYLNSSAGHYSRDGFITSLEASRNRNAIPTGFKALDEELDGGLYPGLYFIGAISSLGKTTFCLQMADQIARAGYDVLIFSLEMGKDELIAKSLSRLTCEMELEAGRGTNNARITRNILNAKHHAAYSTAQREALDQAMTEYGRIAEERIYIHESMGEIGAEQVKEKIEEHILYTGNTPIVIIDYLQILAPYDMRATDKQNTDKAVSELKRVSREKKTSIIGISSFNRENYKERVSMASFKESGAIEYSSDVLIGLQLNGAGQKGFDVDAAKQKQPREIELIILKNRNGTTGAIFDFRYYPNFNYFREMGKKQRDKPARSGKATATDEEETPFNS